jgi:hypothetical protein
MNLLVHRKHPYSRLRHTSAVRSTEILSQAAAEQGKRLTIGLGLDVADSTTAMASLPVLAAADSALHFLPIKRACRQRGWEP